MTTSSGDVCTKTVGDHDVPSAAGTICESPAWQCRVREQRFPSPEGTPPFSRVSAEDAVSPRLGQSRPFGAGARRFCHPALMCVAFGNGPMTVRDVTSLTDTQSRNVNIGRMAHKYP